MDRQLLYVSYVLTVDALAYLGFAAADATIRIWDAVWGRLKHTLRGHLAGISTIAWSPDSKTLASGSDDKSIRLWDVATVSSARYTGYSIADIVKGQAVSGPTARPS